MYHTSHCTDRIVCVLLNIVFVNVHQDGNICRGCRTAAYIFEADQAACRLRSDRQAAGHQSNKSVGTGSSAHGTLYRQMPVRQLS